MSSPFGKKASGLRLERMQSSPRFSDGVFHNTLGVSPGLRPGTGWSTVRQFMFGGQKRRPPGPLPSRSPLDAWLHRPETGLRATWLGHSTVLIEIDGARVLTDPVWGDRASPFSFAGPHRFQPVPVDIDQLPALDAVIISHDHYDHLDYPTILKMASLDVPFYTSLGVGAHLAAWGIAPERIHELDWWESASVPNTDLTITAAPSQHFSGRGVSGRNATLWSSMVVTGSRHKVFFSGDTGLTDEYTAIAERLGPFDLVMLEVGAFHPAWGDIHLGPENALTALTLLGGGALLPVHWGTFNLAIHAWDEPVETLLTLAPKTDAYLVLPRLGVAAEPARAGVPADLIDPWWRALSAEPKRLAAPPEQEPNPTELPMVNPID